MTKTLPDKRGHFGLFGGKYVPETLMAPLKELEEAYLFARRDLLFQKELLQLILIYINILAADL